MDRLLIIWNWDNTLNDTAGSIFKALQDTMLHYNLPVPTREDLNEVLNHHKGAYWEDKFPGHVDEAFNYTMNRFSIYHLDTHLFSKAREVLTFVHQLNIPQIVVSNKPQGLLEEEIDQTKVRVFIQGVVGTDYKLPDKKPMPLFGAKIISSIPHNRLFVIGDGVADMEYATAIGAEGIYIKPAKQIEMPVKFDFRFDDLSEVYHWLKTTLIR